jgi:hypothetical protein
MTCCNCDKAVGEDKVTIKREHCTDCAAKFVTTQLGSPQNANAVADAYKRTGAALATLSDIRHAEDVAQALALTIARGEVVADLEMQMLDADIEFDDVEDFYTEAELDQMAKDMVDIYDNDDHRAECWLYARSVSVENALKQINRPLGTKLKIPA